MIVFVFPGQGSQRKGMGKELFIRYPEYVKTADEILGYSIEDLCINNTNNMLNLTEYTQVAIFIVNALSYLEYVDKLGITPDYVVGHSLGEYNALLAANVFDFETGLKLVKKRGEIMGKVTGGGMAAIMGLSGARVKEILDSHKEYKLQIANYNTDNQIIVAGTKENIMKCEEIFINEPGIRCISLNVSGAFHSSYMDKPREEFELFIKKFKLVNGTIPIISNITAREYEGEDVSKYLVEQINSSVRWKDSVEYLLSKGARHFVEIGENKVLTNMILNIKNNYIPQTLKLQKKEETKKLVASELGSENFRKRYGIKYSYLVGGMYKGISSKEMITQLAKAKLLGSYGTGGQTLENIKNDIGFIKENISKNDAFGVNIVSSMENEKYEEELIDFLLSEEVQNIEVSGYIYITKAIVKYRVKGLKEVDGKIKCGNRIIAKVSRPEIAELFMSPAPEMIVRKLLDEGEISEQQSRWLKSIPIADDICVESDSGGHTDQGVTLVLLPTIIKMRNKIIKEMQYKEYINIGAAGGIGTPDAAGISFILGADFVMTGSVNQCTVEAGTSNYVKTMLQEVSIYDTEYAPAGDMLNFGSKVQVLRKGTFFPSRANKLYDIYKHNNALTDLDESVVNQLEDVYFKKSFQEIEDEIKNHYEEKNSELLKRFNTDSKYKMLQIFKWYFRNSTEFAINGDIDRKVDFQIQCGKSMGTFNEWVKGTKYENWEQRKVVILSELIMNETAEFINKIINKSPEKESEGVY